MGVRGLRRKGKDWADGAHKKMFYYHRQEGVLNPRCCHSIGLLLTSSSLVRVLDDTNSFEVSLTAHSMWGKGKAHAISLKEKSGCPLRCLLPPSPCVFSPGEEAIWPLENLNFQVSLILKGKMIQHKALHNLEHLTLARIIIYIAGISTVVLKALHTQLPVIVLMML